MSDGTTSVEDAIDDLNSSVTSINNNISNLIVLESYSFTVTGTGAGYISFSKTPSKTGYKLIAISPFVCNSLDYIALAKLNTSGSFNGDIRKFSGAAISTSESPKVTTCLTWMKII